MSTLVGVPQTSEEISYQTPPSALPRKYAPAWCIGGLSAAVLAIHGYHPYSEDGGIYVASARHALDPSLYPSYTGFATAHIACALFGRGMALLSHVTHLSLDSVFFLVYFASVGLTLAGVRRLATACLTSSSAQWSVTALVAVWFTLPIAGTSLDFMDPYLTARSLAFPAVLFAAVALLDPFRRLRPRLEHAALLLLIAALLHPLTAVYGLFFLLLMMLIQNRRMVGAGALCISAIGLAGLMQGMARLETPEYRAVVLTRGYWYLTSWAWYEVLGVFLPLVILAAISFPGSRVVSSQSLSLLRASLLAGVTAIAVNLAFAHPDGGSHLVASLQPLRLFQFVYLAMILALGALLGRYVLQQKPLRWALTFIPLGLILFLSQRATYSGTEHLEMPWRSPHNPWVQAFRWAHDHTPKDALFALDSHYISVAGEDGQLFRSIAQRSALPDYSKDGGISSVKPDLSSQWQTGAAAQDRLNVLPDRLRLARLQPFGVTWIVLPSGSGTGFDCPYRNVAVKVCALPRMPSLQR